MPYQSHQARQTAGFELPQLLVADAGAIGALWTAEIMVVTQNICIATLVVLCELFI